MGQIVQRLPVHGVQFWPGRVPFRPGGGPFYAASYRNISPVVLVAHGAMTRILTNVLPYKEKKVT